MTSDRFRHLTLSRDSGIIRPDMEKRRKQIVGKEGENLAQAFLESQGYRVIGRNVRTCCGEIDIIARAGRHICFIEVKTRKDRSRGTPEEAVGPRKQRNLSRAALVYVQNHQLQQQALRFDVIAIYDPGMGIKPEIRLIKNAFPLAQPYML